VIERSKSCSFCGWKIKVFPPLSKLDTHTLPTQVTHTATNDEPISVWERSLNDVCLATFPEGVTRKVNGVFIHERTSAPDETIKWFQRGALFHFSSEHPYKLGNPRDLLRVMQFASAAFLRTTDLFNIAFAFETTDGGLQEDSHRRVSGVDAILTVARDPAYRSPTMPMRSRRPHVVSFEPPPALQARHLIHHFGFDRTMDYLLERELEFARSAGIAIERSAFLDELDLTDDEMWRLRSLPAGANLWSGNTTLPRGVTLLATPDQTGPYFDIANTLWQFRNSCSAEVLRALGRKLPTFSLGGYGHADDLARELDATDGTVLAGSEDLVKWKADLLASAPERNNGRFSGPDVAL
jgi:hypothetical protein